MKKNNKIRKIFLFIIYISIIPSIFSSITQFTEEELKEYNKLSNTADRLNNGITKFINDYSYDGECLSIARNGSAGSCFYHNYKLNLQTLF